MTPVQFNLPFDSNVPESLAGALAERLESLSAQIDYEKSKERQLRIANNQLTEERDALSASVQSLQSQFKVLEASATSPLALVPLARQLLELARKSAGLPLPELQAPGGAQLIFGRSGSLVHHLACIFVLFRIL
jgi:hypothetical protein